MIEADDFIVDLLTAHGLVTDEQVEAAKTKLQEESSDGTVLDGLYLTKVVTEQDVVQILASEYGMDSFAVPVIAGIKR